MNIKDTNWCCKKQYIKAFEYFQIHVPQISLNSFQIQKMLIKQLTILILLLSGLTNYAIAFENKHPETNINKSPLGLFKPLLGNWRIKDFQLDKNGQWQPAAGADWNFYSILNGSAIQDDWISPSLTQPAPKKGRQYGTNIRIYNPEKKQWQMAWIANTGKKVETFIAEEKNGQIIMRGNYIGTNTRITFYNISSKNFSWKMEQEVSKKNQNSATWKTVYKIEGTKISN
ncbi:hypothetical protein [Aliikangiella sp. IMCC44359]|uniref:hypothetical protein n=1 Tax=Aliikangiella sp. IMCC44359 TaxID=3459125 RepID=UPI00403AA91A